MNKLRHWIVTVSGLPRRKRSRAVVEEVRQRQAELDKPLELAQFGARFEFRIPFELTDDAFPDPATTRWPETCVTEDPCGVKFDNDADRSYWFECLNHRSPGRHAAGRMYV